MKNEQKIYAAAGVLAVRSRGPVPRPEERQARDASCARPARPRPVAPRHQVAADDVDKVTKIEIKNAAKGEVVLEKQGDAGRSPSRCPTRPTSRT